MDGDEGPRLSADGGWWWNGADWVPAVSDDGIWRWDGKAWRVSIAASAADPAAVVEELDRLADERFAQGGQLLALRAHEWRPRTDDLAALVAQAAPLAARLAALDAQLAGADGRGLGPSLRALLGGGERGQLEGEARRVEEDLRPLAALIGRTAPQPSLKEADGILVPARRLHDQVLELRQAVARLRELEAEQARRVAAARAEVEEAARAREVALSAHSARLQDREDEHGRAVADLAAALRSLRMPGPGAAVATFAGLTLYEDRVDTPDGRGPVPGARAVIGTARELAETEAAAVDELFRLEAAYAGPLHDAWVGGDPSPFLLVCTDRAISAVPVPEAGEEEAAGFVAALEGAAAGGARRRAAWAKQVRAAQDALEAALADTALVDEARADLERAREDPDLAAPVKDAERRLGEAEDAEPELVAARARVEELVEALLTPPAGLEFAAPA